MGAEKEDGLTPRLPDREKKDDKTECVHIILNLVIITKGMGWEEPTDATVEPAGEIEGEEGRADETGFFFPFETRGFLCLR